MGHDNSDYDNYGGLDFTATETWHLFVLDLDDPTSSTGSGWDRSADNMEYMRMDGSHPAGASDYNLYFDEFYAFKEAPFGVASWAEMASKESLSDPTCSLSSGSDTLILEAEPLIITNPGTYTCSYADIQNVSRRAPRRTRS